jgi:PKD repeat protein
MKKEKIFLFLMLISLYSCFLSCSKEDVYNVSPSGVKSDFSIVVTDSTIKGTSLATNFSKFVWTFGDGSTSTEANPTYTYKPKKVGGNYTVQLTAYGAEGAVSQKEKIVTILLKPIVGFDVTLDTLSVKFKNNSNQAASNLWDFGDGKTSTLAEPTYTYPENTGTTPKVYSVKLTVTNAKGSSTATKEVTIYPKPVVDFTYTVDATRPLTNPGRVVSFLSTSKYGTSTSWDFGDNTTSTEDDVIHTFPSKDKYEVTLTIKNSRKTVKVSKIIDLR